MSTNIQKPDITPDTTTVKHLGGSEQTTAEVLSDGAGSSLFRNFSTKDFCPTSSWRALEQILDSNGGCFGLYGPRGSGKSWLMRMAIEHATEKGGLGLWYPCPSKYDAKDFLSTLSDNLANALERRFSRNIDIERYLKIVRNIAAVMTILLALIAFSLYLVADAIRDYDTTHKLAIPATTHAIPAWELIGVPVLVTMFLSIITLIYSQTSPCRLAREARLLRERLRYTESLKRGTDMHLSGGKGLIASLGHSSDRNLSERPTSVASLVFDFRHLAEHVVSQLNKPLIICIDELDKMEDPAEVRSLLRDIKGIFEVSGTHFLVSVSQEAASSLQIGILQSGGRNELNSSFYSMIVLAPLEPDEAHDLLARRKLNHSRRFSYALCMLAGGNRRELIRMADVCARYSARRQIPLDEYTITEVMSEESFALLEEITRILPDQTPDAAEYDGAYQAWTALPRDAFDSVDAFIKLGTSAIRGLWDPPWRDEAWASVQESWRRLLIRLFVAATVLPGSSNQKASCLLDDEASTTNMREILTMATRDARIAQLMLFAKFGGDLSEKYRRAPARPSR